MENLNQRAAALCEQLLDDADRLGVDKLVLDCRTRLVDCGVRAPGGEEAGLWLARICLADLGTVQLVDDDGAIGTARGVRVATDEPLVACMGSQYAGWAISADGYFAMGSGPMRCAACREPLLKELGLCEPADECVGVLESGQLPPEAVCRQIAERCGIDPARLTLLVAPTNSPAGMVQVVARSVETAMHKLHELRFDLHRVVSGQGTAPLPPLADSDLAAIGRTNDAVLYGGQTSLQVRGNDLSLQEIGPRIPSSASPDYGRPFAEVLARYDNDFYQIDPLLFSPAVITLENLDTGNSFRFGEINHEVLGQSFA